MIENSPSPDHAERANCGKAFTLIEFLVVIAIITVLASLLLPALSKAKGRAVATECRQNLRDVALAMRMYVDDFEAFPRASAAWTVSVNSTYGVLTGSDGKDALLPFIGLASSPEERTSSGRESHMRKLRCPLFMRKPDGTRGNSQYACDASDTAPLGSPADLGLDGFWQDHGFWQVRDPHLELRPSGSVSGPSDSSSHYTPPGPASIHR